MKQAAAIRRASRQARYAMQDLDRRGVEELLVIYGRAAHEVRARIAAAVDGQLEVPQHQLRALLAQIEAVVDGLEAARDALVLRSIDEAAALGVRPYTLPGLSVVGGSEAVLESTEAVRLHAAAVRFVREFVHADGLTLSDRLWRLNRGAKEALTRAIGQAVVMGHSAARAAQDFMLAGDLVPGDVVARIAAGKGGALLQMADDLTDRSSSVFQQVERVFRTEINRAHGEAYMAAGEKTPGFAGWKYLLSPEHPAPDICDLLSAQNLHGLGAGVYPDRERCPWPAHPNTLSFVVIVFADEISDADRAGKETTLQALGRLAPEVRAGAVGKTKAEYFDQGLLRTGMIRSPLRAVNARLGRLGQAPTAGSWPAHPQAVPKAADAVIPREKLLHYALNPDHPIGGNKARVFASALGFTQDNVQQLMDVIAQRLPGLPAHSKGVGPHGELFQVDVPVTGPKGSGTVRTGWIIRTGESFARLTSAYVKSTARR